MKKTVYIGKTGVSRSLFFFLFWKEHTLFDMPAQNKTLKQRRQ